jgi:phosphocarrier protein
LEENKMIKKEIILPYHLLARRAVELSIQIKDSVNRPFFIQKDNRRANAKSLLGILSLGAKEGEKVFLISEKEEDVVKVEEIIKSIKEEF